MDSAQFTKWLRNHLKRFNSVETWLRAKPEKGAEGIVGQNDVMEAWFGALADVRIDDAIQATEAMFKGEAPLPLGPGYDDHPRAVRRLAMQRAEQRAKSTKKMVNGEPVVNCPDCRDRGWREIWTGKFLAWAREVFADGPPHDEKGNELRWLLWRFDPRVKAAPKLTTAPVSAVVACSCPAGRFKAEKGCVVFNASRDVPYDPFTLGEAIEKFQRTEF